MAIPYFTFQQGYAGGTPGISANFTFSFIVNGFEAWIPITEFFSGQVSVGGTITVYRSTDGGASWNTVGVIVGSFPSPETAASSFVRRQHIKLGPGTYLIQLQTSTHSGNASHSVGMDTVQQITAYA